MTTASKPQLHGQTMLLPKNIFCMSLKCLQNFVSPANLGRVLDFLRPGRVELVSGCKEEDRATLHERFVSALRQHKPQVLADLEAQRASRKKKVNVYPPASHLKTVDVCFIQAYACMLTGCVCQIYPMLHVCGYVDNAGGGAAPLGVLV